AIEAVNRCGPSGATLVSRLAVVSEVENAPPLRTTVPVGQLAVAGVCARQPPVTGSEVSGLTPTGPRCARRGGRAGRSRRPRPVPSPRRVPSRPASPQKAGEDLADVHVRPL